ncbi:type IV secretion system protein VirB3 [Gilvimarinus chinensis]|uniref:type IV secretion system protein VirB3 n=1 Tax=Gilvimarinus chinensis TaxID=396005 RepID=UPI00036C58EB|nr:type IV secretion system protein VirB3 [Gilvimarinus chinensis]
MSKESKEVALENDILFAGATRPAMVWGVTYEFCVVNLLFGAMFFLGVGNPFYIAIVVPGHVLGYLICMNEPRLIGIFFIWLQTMAKCRNRVFWKGSTYTPH